MATSTMVTMESNRLEMNRKRFLDVAFWLIGTLVAAMVAACIFVAMWAPHEFTEVESIVALHANMLLHGQGLYHGLNQYPFTVAAYGPIFYGVVALLHSARLPLHQSGRLISVGALLAAFWLVWRIATILVDDARAWLTAVLLAACGANLLFWGTVGQTDMLACCFSLGAFHQYLLWRNSKDNGALIGSGALVLLALFTKQTALAGGASIALCLLVNDRKRGIRWVAGVAAFGAAVFAAIDLASQGHYFENAVLANMNPFWGVRLKQQLSYFLSVDSGLLLPVVAGLGKVSRRVAPLYVYTGMAAVVWLLTAAKLGSDLNYQMELALLLSLCAGCSLDRLRFFLKIGGLKPAAVQLLQIPVLLYLVLNLGITAKFLIGRVSAEQIRSMEEAGLASFLSRNIEPVISAQYDSLLKAEGKIEVEPLIYTILVGSGRVNPAPVIRDLAARRFKTIVLHEDVFLSQSPAWKSAETPTLPEPEVDEIRKHYVLVRHVKGPYLDGDYVYQPRTE